MTDSSVVIHGQCPWCGYVTDRATSSRGSDTPSPGDLSLCFKCGEWTVFDQKLSHRKPREDEYEEIADSEMCRQMRRAWVEMIVGGQPR